MRRLTTPFLTVIVMLLLVAPSAGAQSGCGQPVSVDGATLISGDGRLNTRALDLGPGAHTVRYSASKTGQFGSNLIVILKPTSGSPLEQHLLVNTLLSSDRPDASGETQVYGLKAGSYYFEVTAPGRWEISISPQV